MLYYITTINMLHYYLQSKNFENLFCITQVLTVVHLTDVFYFPMSVGKTCTIVKEFIINGYLTKYCWSTLLIYGTEHLLSGWQLF